MIKQRTGGMTAIGILNIVFGALGMVVALGMTFLGGLFAAGGTLMATDASMAEVEGGAEMSAAIGGLGGMVMLFGLGLLLAWTLLMVSGIGVLKLAPWGRTLSILCGGVILLLNGFSLITSEFSVMNLAGAVYGGLLVFLFMQPAWKAAFSGVPAAGHEFATQDNYRAAA